MLDRRRIRQLSERESAALDERTRGSAAMFRRARRVLAGGVASSFQGREPWPIYLTRGEGQRVWDVDGNEFFDFHNGFSSMLQGHAHPAIGAAISRRYGHGTHFAAPTEDAILVAEELSRRWKLTRWRFTNSGTESTLGAIRIARGLTGGRVGPPPHADLSHRHDGRRADIRRSGYGGGGRRSRRRRR
jgi:glutamate-1-semialdehyde 2,1-aminomutase